MIYPVDSVIHLLNNWGLSNQPVNRPFGWELCEWKSRGKQTEGERRERRGGFFSPSPFPLFVPSVFPFSFSIPHKRGNCLIEVPDFVSLMRKVLLGSFHANFHFRNSSSDVRVLSFIAQWALAFATNRHVTKHATNEWMKAVVLFLFALFAKIVKKALNELAGLTVGM